MSASTRATKRSAAAGESSAEDEPIQLVASRAKKLKSAAAKPAAAMPAADAPAGSAKPAPSLRKLAPIFTPRAASGASAEASGSTTSSGSARVVWRAPLRFRGKPGCLLGVCGAPFAAAVEKTLALPENEREQTIKVAAFDLDGTLVVPKQGTWPSPSDPYDYKPVFANVYKRVREEYESGSVIVIVSNQKQTTPYDISKPAKKVLTWQQKIAHIAQAIGCPMLVLAALADDRFRKPAPGMWDATMQELEVAGGKRAWVKVGGDGSSFYVGDAAGRPARGRIAKDHNDTDRKWADNLGLPFFTPEQWFQGGDAEDYKLKGWRLSWAKDDAEPSKPAIAPASSPEILVFVGPPASGKTSYYRNHFEPAGYEWINQDTLGKRDKCIAKAREALQKGKSVVIDNTNRDKATRAFYVKLAAERGVPIRCAWFELSSEQVVHNSYYRAHHDLGHEPERNLIPGIAIGAYFSALQVPTQDEGFAEPPAVVKFRFQGDAAAREAYSKWWQ